ncbi:MAG: hypothetical protein GTO35_12845, partial [Gammaproteobacteria bacterium]|nr:hypothetical protein [Gammaproteobacteria bacterium]
MYPGAQELCDNKDNDCNSGTADGSGESWYGTACDGPDSDLCEEGTYECTGGAQICSDSTGDNLEICDGADNDCDGSIDEGYDVDNDTYTVCNGDCDDNNPSINPETYWYQDSDGDSYGNLSVPLQQCIQPEGYVSDSSDCDDSDPDIYPGGPAVRITGVSPAYYSTLQAAYDTAV